MTTLICLRRFSNEGIRKAGRKTRFTRKVKLTVGGALVTCAAGGGLLYGSYMTLDKAVHYKPECIGSEEAGNYIYLKPLNSKQDDLVSQVKSRVQWNYHALESIVLEHDETGWTSVLPFGQKKHRLWNDPRSLLLKAQSDNRAERLAAVRALARRHIWHDHEYRLIAQSCDRRTLVGLARINNVDERFFLPPPVVQESVHESMEDELRQLLAALPKTSIDPCTKYFTMAALQGGQSSQADDQTGSLVFGGNHLSFITSLSKIPEESLFTTYLLALISHSEVISHCKELVRLGVLQLLIRIYQYQPDSPKVNCYLAQVIANLAVCEALHADIVQAGWVTVLVKWKKSKFTELASQAARALANLDVDDTERRVKYANGVNIIHPLGRTRKAMHADVVFVHGLMGGAFYTWRQGHESQDKEKLVSLTDGALTTPMNDEKELSKHRNSVGRFTDCWPKSWLAKDYPNVRILTITYDTQLTEWTSKCPFESEKRSISQRSGEILQKLKEAGLGQRPIIWVTHSMGGLLVKQMIIDAEHTVRDEIVPSIAKQTRAVIFYSTPHHGTSLAAYSQQAKYLLLPSVEVKELVQGSPYLKDLHGKFRAFVQAKQIPILSFGETKPTNIGLSIRTHVVPTSSSNPGFGEHYDLEMNHLNICKPASQTSLLYQLTLQFIVKHLKQSFTSELSEKLSHELDDEESENLLPFMGMYFGD